MGTPIGSDAFIRQYLAEETNNLMTILDDIQTAVGVGHVDDRFATRQGIIISCGIVGTNCYVTCFAR